MQSELESIREKKLSGNRIRSRAQWIEDGEKPSKFFLNLEKRNAVNKIISHLTSEDGFEIFDDDGIHQEVYKFYKRLYSSHDFLLRDVDLNEICHHSVRKLSDGEAAGLEGPLGYDEVYHALRSMKNNKSPGTDGFTVEFFKFFWDKLGWFLVRSLNYAYSDGQMSITQRHGIITLIPNSEG